MPTPVEGRTTPKFALESWGPAAWTLIHTICLTSKDPAAVRELFDNLTRTLPCPRCRANLVLELADNPVPVAEEVQQQGVGDTDGKTAGQPRALKVPNLFKWSVELHNAVNARLGKPVMSLGDAYTTYLGIERTPTPPAGAQAQAQAGTGGCRLGGWFCEKGPSGRTGVLLTAAGAVALMLAALWLANRVCKASHPQT